MEKIIYQVWICVQKSIADEWLQWMKKVHIPQVMETKCFCSYTCWSCDGPRTASDERAFVIQYEATISNLKTYFTQHASALQADHSLRYKDLFRAERCILSQLNTAKTTNSVW